MLQGYYVRNFKGFKSADILINPLTILLGPNNGGKTSLTEILLMMQQTAIATTTGYAAPLRINGRIVSLGAPEHLFHNKQTTEPIVFGFRFKSESLVTRLRRMQKKLGQDIYSVYRDLLRYYEHIYLDNSTLKEKDFPSPSNFRVSVKSRRELSKPSNIDEMLEFILNLKKLSLAPELKLSDHGLAEMLLFPRGHISDDTSLLENSPLDLKLTSNFIRRLNETVCNEFTIEFQIEYFDTKPNLHLTRICLKSSEQIIVELDIDSFHRTLTVLNSDMIDNPGQLSKYRTSLSELMTYDSTIFSTFSKSRHKSSRHLISATIAETLHHSFENLSLCFTPRMLSHVSPIRAYPKRFYFSDQANADQLQGDNYIDLLRDNPKLCDKVNKWLSGFGIQINIEQVREVLQRAAIVQDGLDIDLDILDVGFGVSQVLPVVIQAFLVPYEGISVIEQPEIHLHPKMQADLLDFFLDIIYSSKENGAMKCGNFILETHSVALLRRLRTRLVLSDTLYNLVAIYSVERSLGESTINRITIDSLGEFQWPKAFLEPELEDTIQFISKIVRKEN